MHAAGNIRRPGMRVTGVCHAASDYSAATAEDEEKDSPDRSAECNTTDDASRFFHVIIAIWAFIQST